MSGQVSWVGSSSLIIHMKLTRESDDVDVLVANFTFVARDIISGKSCRPVAHVLVSFVATLSRPVLMKRSVLCMQPRQGKQTGARN